MSFYIFDRMRENGLSKKLQFIEALAETKTEEDMTEAQSKYQQKTVNVSLMSPSGVA